MSASSTPKVRQLFEQALRQRIGSGIAASWGTIGDPSSVQEVYSGVEGHAGIAGRSTAAIDRDSVFDLASLTKVLATTSVAMVAVDRGLIKLSDQDETLKAMGVPATIGDLLSHTSGLPAWKPVYDAMKMNFGSNLPFASIADRRDAFFKEVASVAPECGVGEKVIYSDVGFWHLGRILETKLGAGMDRLTQDWVWRSIKDCHLHYRPVKMDAAGERYRIQQACEKVVMTELCPWRGLLQGQVHDDNAWSAGGVMGHAGVFGRLRDVTSWVHALFNESFVSARTLHAFLREVPAPAFARRAYGFDLVSLDGSGSTASAFSASSVGHLGFTGTSVWMDLDTGFFAVLLTNRVHPDRTDTRIRSLRQAFHTLLADQP